VHALRHVHELLVPGGTMLDLHPVTEEQVEAEGRIIGVIREPEFVATDLPNAEARLEQAIEEGLYALEAEISFDVLQHFDRAEELLAAKDEHLAGQEALARRIRAATPPLAIREHVVLRRLRALSAAG
jgi:hypothetical protein